jgi:hypothetical protein
MNNNELKFLNWNVRGLNCQDFNEVVSQAWAKPVAGINPMMRLHNRLRLTAFDLKA